MKMEDNTLFIVRQCLINICYTFLLLWCSDDVTKDYFIVFPQCIQSHNGWLLSSSTGDYNDLKILCFGHVTTTYSETLNSVQVKAMWLWTEEIMSGSSMCVFQNGDHTPRSESERWWAVLVLKGSLMWCVRQGQRSGVRGWERHKPMQEILFIYLKMCFFAAFSIYNWICMWVYYIHPIVYRKGVFLCFGWKY